MAFRGMLVALLVLSSGCVPFPVLPFGDQEWSRQNISDSVPEGIVLGQTTRADVILAIGDPDRRSKDDARFHYVRATEEGGVAFLFGGGLRGGVTGTPVTFRTLTITFDARGVVSGATTGKIVKRDFGPHISGDLLKALFPDVD